MNTFVDTIQAALPGSLLSTKPTRVRIDEGPFKLYYRATTILLLLCVALVSCGEYFGSKIHCVPVTLGSEVVVQSKFLETYCFIRSTFTVHPVSNIGGKETDLVAGGPQHIPGKTTEMYHVYYQWIPFVLFMQAFFFYIPYYIWKNVEHKRMKSLLQRMNEKNLEVDPAEISKAIKKLGKYLWDARQVEIWWGYTYVFCEYFNLGVVLLNSYFTDLLLGRNFLTYGIDIIKGFHDEEGLDVIESSRKLFPTVSKCNFMDFGASGSIQTVSTVCVLPMNVVNERVFTFLWFWYILLAIVTSAFLVYRTATMLSFRLRLASIPITVPELYKAKYVEVLEKLGVRGWILLRLLSLNLEENLFQRVMIQIHSELIDHYSKTSED